MQEESVSIYILTQLQGSYGLIGVNDSTVKTPDRPSIFLEGGFILIIIL